MITTTQYRNHHSAISRHIDGAAQDYSYPIANALGLLQSCIKPSIYHLYKPWYDNLIDLCSKKEINLERKEVESAKG